MLNGLRAGLVGLAFLVFGVAGCAPAPAVGLPAEPAAATASAGAQEAVSDRIVPEYRLGVADKVRVNVFGEEALTGEFLVGSGGKVSLPLIGEVQAAGYTISQFQSEIAEALKQGYIMEPRVSAEASRA